MTHPVLRTVWTDITKFVSGLVAIIILGIAFFAPLIVATLTDNHYWLGLYIGYALLIWLMTLYRRTY